VHLGALNFYDEAEEGRVIVTSDLATLHENYNGIVINNDIAIIHLPEAVSGPSNNPNPTNVRRDSKKIFKLQTLRLSGCPLGPWPRKRSRTRQEEPVDGEKLRIVSVKSDG